MAFAQKYTTTATTKTHGLEDASLLEIVLPTTPLDSTGTLIRSAAHFALGWVGRGYKENGSFGL